MMRKAAIALRLSAVLGGGYALTGLAVLVCARLLAQLGVAASDAVVAAALAGFPLYLGVLLWGLACTRATRVCAWTAAWIGVLGGIYWMIR